MWGAVAAGKGIGADLVPCSSVAVEGMETPGRSRLMCNSLVAVGPATRSDYRSLIVWRFKAFDVSNHALF